MRRSLKREREASENFGAQNDAAGCLVQSSHSVVEKLLLPRDKEYIQSHS